MGNDFVFLGAGAIHDARDAIRAEQPHQIVLKADEKVGRTRIALPRAAAPQLAVNAPGFVALGADDVQSANLCHA